MWLRKRTIVCDVLVFVILLATFSYVDIAKQRDVDNVTAQLRLKLERLAKVRASNRDMWQLLLALVSPEVDQELAMELGIAFLQQKFSVPDLAEDEPSLANEKLRRRVERNIGELVNFLGSEVQEAEQESTFSSSSMRRLLSQSRNQSRSLLNKIKRLQEIDTYDPWRSGVAHNLSDLVQRRLKYLQTPRFCRTARKLLCDLNKNCGFGCQLHHVVYCFIVAYATERTMVLNSHGWSYNQRGWEGLFRPVSKCTVNDIASHEIDEWPGTSDTKVLHVPIIDALRPRPPYLPLTIPEDLAASLKKFHGNPSVWWIGQFMTYLWKPQPSVHRLLKGSLAKLGFKGPIVGIHVRRTDKVGTEAAFHGIDEYMIHAEEYFKRLEAGGRSVKRRVYIASDEPSVIAEIRVKYPRYTVIGDAAIAKVAAVNTRYSNSSLNGIVLDMHLLSLCDHLVCTFSSQVCRVAYELMQGRHVDAAHKFTSLDDIYYFGGQHGHTVDAVIAHRAARAEEISMIVGDVLGVAGNHWDGFSKGESRRTGKLGLYPSFKVNDGIPTAKFPTYPNVL